MNTVKAHSFQALLSLCWNLCLREHVLEWPDCIVPKNCVLVMKRNLLSVKKYSKVEGGSEYKIGFSHLFKTYFLFFLCVIIFLHLFLIKNESVLYCLKARKQFDNNYFVFSKT